MNTYSATTRTVLPHRARALALAFTFALAASSIPAVQAYAEPVDPGVRCAAKVGDNHYEFFLPGQRATDKDGNKWVCGPDGVWFRDYSSIGIQPSTPRPPVRVPVNTILVAPLRS